MAITTTVDVPNRFVPYSMIKRIFGISVEKARLIVEVSGVRKRKRGFKNPAGFYISMTVVNEREFEVAFLRVMKESEPTEKRFCWRHPVFGRFTVDGYSGEDIE